MPRGGPGPSVIGLGVCTCGCGKQIMHYKGCPPTRWASKACFKRVRYAEGRIKKRVQQRHLSPKPRRKPDVPNKDEDLPF